MTTQGSRRRTKEIAKIHCLKRDLRLDDDTYRGVLYQLAGVRSSSELDAKGRTQVITWLGQQTGDKQDMANGRPHNLDSENAPAELKKIEALLLDQGLSWAYANAICKRMFKVARIALCSPEQFRGVIAALMVAKRRKEKAGGA